MWPIHVAARLGDADAELAHVYISLCGCAFGDKPLARTLKIESSRKLRRLSDCC